MIHKVRHHAKKVAHSPVIEMIPAGVAVIFEAVHMEWFHKGIVTVVALTVIVVHYFKKKD